MMTCWPKRAHSPTASSTIEVFALAVGGGASGFHDEAGQGPSGASPAALVMAGLGADVQAATRRTSTRVMRRLPPSTRVGGQRRRPASDAADHRGGHAFGVALLPEE